MRRRSCLLRDGTVRTVALHMSLDGIEGVQEGVLRHAGNGPGDAMVEPGALAVPFLPFQLDLLFLIDWRTW